MPHRGRSGGGSCSQGRLVICETVVEYGETEEVYTHPKDPYTQALLSAIPIPDPQIERTRKRLVYQDGKLVPAESLLPTKL